jgi:hypothetical protein
MAFHRKGVVIGWSQVGRWRNRGRFRCSFLRGSRHGGFLDRGGFFDRRHGRLFDRGYGGLLGRSGYDGCIRRCGSLGWFFKCWHINRRFLGRCLSGFLGRCFSWLFDCRLLGSWFLRRRRFLCRRGLIRR